MQQNIATTPASVKLPNPLRERIKSLADARNQSAHAIMLQAIENYVEREEKREADDDRTQPVSLFWQQEVSFFHH